MTLIIDKKKYQDLASALHQELKQVLSKDKKKAPPGAKPVEVYSAVKLTQEEKDLLERALEKKFPQDFFIINTISPELIGGLKIKIGDDIYDDSLLNRVDQINKFYHQNVQ